MTQFCILFSVRYEPNVSPKEADCIQLWESVVCAGLNQKFRNVRRDRIALSDDDSESVRSCESLSEVRVHQRSMTHGRSK